MLDDWDQRLVVTTLQVDEEGHRLELQQVAEKDQVSEDCFVSLCEAFRVRNDACVANIRWDSNYFHKGCSAGC